MDGNSLKTDIVTLLYGDHRMDVVPVMGAVASWSWRGHDVFRPSASAAIAARDPLGLACFAMAPWVSRVRDSRFQFRSRRVQLKPETDPRLGQFSIHGEVWRAPWRLIEASPTSVTMQIGPGADGAWPWDYSCVQTVALDERGLTMTLCLRSHSDEPFPCTFGLHPYFARRADSRLTARVRHRAILSPDGMPHGEEDGSRRWRNEPITRGVEDHCYRGWDGVAVIAFPGEGFQVRLHAEGCEFLQVYAPDEDYFCVEPQTGGPDALNRGLDGGVRVLAPGAEDTITVCFTPEPI
jgi:aldose 1-epimerase